MGISFPKKVDHSRTLLIPKMISLLLFLIPLSSSRLLDELNSPSFLDEDQAEMRAEMRAKMRAEMQAEMQAEMRAEIRAEMQVEMRAEDRTCNCDCANAKTEVTTEDYGHGCYTYDN